MKTIKKILSLVFIIILIQLTIITAQSYGWNMDDLLNKIHNEVSILDSNADGTTEEDNKIYISNKEDMIQLMQRVNLGESLSGYTVELQNDINLNCNENNPWTPIGNDKYQFSGTFEGNGHSISGMYISSSDIYGDVNISSSAVSKGSKFVGLFGYGNKAKINNLTIKDSTINIKEKKYEYILSTYMGIIAGYAVAIQNCCTENCNINCTIEESVGFDYYVGGIVGKCSDVEKVKSKTNITLNILANSSHNMNFVGGILGEGHYSKISNCSYEGNINVPRYAGAVGGIVGDAGGYDLVKNCHNMGNITTSGANNYNCRRHTEELLEEIMQEFILVTIVEKYLGL